MKNKLKCFVAGVLITSIVMFSFTGFNRSITKKIKVAFNGVNIIVNGNLVNVDNLVYESRTYLQLSNMCDILDKDFEYDAATDTAYIKDKSSFSTGSNIKAAPVKPATNGVFQGFFKNTVYDDPKAFTYSNDQTSINDDIKKIAANFNNKKDISTMQEIFKWIQSNLKYADGEKFTRTSIDIITNKTTTGCTDYGLAFAALSRAKGIPTVFVQTGRIDWIEKVTKDLPGKGMITGHILVEVMLNDNKWYLVDSTAGKLYLDYIKNNFSLSDGYYVFAKSIEVWDSGIMDEADNYNKMLNLFANFTLLEYNNPRYDYIDLSNGKRLKSGEFTCNRYWCGYTW